MKATDQYFPVVLFIMLYKVALTFESVDEILKCGHLNKTIEQYFPVCGTVYYTVQGGSNFWVNERNPKVWPFTWKHLSITFQWYCLLLWCMVVCTFVFVSEIQKCGHECSWKLLRMYFTVGLFVLKTLQTDHLNILLDLLSGEKC